MFEYLDEDVKNFFGILNRTDKKRKREKEMHKKPNKTEYCAKQFINLALNLSSYLERNKKLDKKEK